MDLSQFGVEAEEVISPVKLKITQNILSSRLDEEVEPVHIVTPPRSPSPACSPIPDEPFFRTEDVVIDCTEKENDIGTAMLRLSDTQNTSLLTVIFGQIWEFILVFVSNGCCPYFWFTLSVIVELLF